MLQHTCCNTLYEELGLENRDIQLIFKRYEDEGSQFLTKVLPSFYKGLLSHMESSGSVHGFKHPAFKSSNLHGGLPFFLLKFTSALFEHNDDLEFHPLYVVGQVCCMFYKVKADFSSKQIEDAMEGFISHDNSCHRFNVEGYHPSIVKFFKLMNRVMFHDIPDQYKLITRDGPGASSEGEPGKLNKLFNLPSRRLGAQLFFNNNAAFDNLPTKSAGGSHYGVLFPGSELPARMVAVPKDSRGPRLISCEPSQNMRLQLPLMDMMMRSLEKNSSHSINFLDSSTNSKNALIGSTNKSLATIDLEAASDRVPYAALSLFPEKLSRNLDITRSRYITLLDGRIHKLKKFAPMGSACCFPVLSYYTYCAVLYCMILEDAGDLTKVKIFGDDIIMPSSPGKSIAKNLSELFNLKLNSTKSYSNCSFRESCGGEYYDGFDVSTFKVRVLEDSLDGYASLIEMANLAYSKGLRKYPCTLRYI